MLLMGDQEFQRMSVSKSGDGMVESVQDVEVAKSWSMIILCQFQEVGVIQQEISSYFARSVTGVRATMLYKSNLLRHWIMEN